MTLRTWVRTVSTETVISLADLLGGVALGHQVHDLALARRELRHARGRARREQDAVQARVDVRAAGGDLADRGEQLLHVPAFSA